MVAQWWMMNWNGCERKQVPSHYLPRKTEEKQEKLRITSKVGRY
jgi:hypothetical protein